MAVGAISETVNNLILTSSVLTIILTPAAFQIAPRLGHGLSWLRLPSASASLSTDEAALNSQALVIGYGRVGGYVVAGLRRAGVPVAVVEQDLRLVRQVRSHGVPAIYGDASHVAIMDAAHPERACLVVVALPDVGTTRAVVRALRQRSPSVPILVRVAREEEEEALVHAGATFVAAPERAGALLLLEESRRLLGLFPNTG